MTEFKPEQFEMRRLESLSNTIFGVAMTLLAYDLPKAGVFTNAPDWSDLAQAYSGKLAGFALSFIIAGLFWISHHRRLARQPVGSRGAVILNLFFLLSIVLLPVTNGLYTNYAMSSAVAVLYGLHLTAIAGLNAWLWWTILGGWRRAGRLWSRCFRCWCLCRARSLRGSRRMSRPSCGSSPSADF